MSLFLGFETPTASSATGAGGKFASINWGSDIYFAEYFECKGTNNILDRY